MNSRLYTKFIIGLVVLILILPAQLAAAVRKYEPDIVYQNTSGIYDEKSWDAYEAKRIETERIARLQRYQASDYGTYCSCVKYVQARGYNVKTLNGYASSIPVTSQIPSLTGLVVTYEGYYGHIAIYRLEGQNLILDEANYFPCRQTSGRILPITSPIIKGYL